MDGAAGGTVRFLRGQLCQDWQFPALLNSSLTYCQVPQVTRPACVPCYGPLSSFAGLRQDSSAQKKQGKPWEFITCNLISREKTEACVEACWTTHSSNSFPTLSTSGTVTQFCCMFPTGWSLYLLGRLVLERCQSPWRAAVAPRFLCLCTGQQIGRSWCKAACLIKFVILQKDLALFVGYY